MPGPPPKKTRRSVQDFSKSCKSDIHQQLVKDDDVVTLNKTTSKSYNKIQLQWLRTNGLFPQRGSYVCNRCLEYAKINLDRKVDDAVTKSTERDNPGTSDNVPPSDDSAQPPSEEPATTDHQEGAKKSPVDDIIELLRKGELTDQDMSDLCFEVGKSLSDVIYKDTKKLAGKYKDISKSLTVDIKEYLDERPTPVIDLLSGLTTSRKWKDMTPKKQYPLCLLFEQLYLVRNANFVGPCSFSQGLLKWTVHGSKIAHTLDGAVTAAGSIRTLKRRLEECGNDKNRCFDGGDVDVFADNVQRVGKTTRVREGGTTPVHVATNVVFIQSNPPTSYQENEELTPDKWFGKTPPGSLGHQMNEFEEELASSQFRPYRIKQQQQLIADVMKETSQSNGIFTDHISKRVDLNKKEVVDECVCPRCATVYLRSSSRTCPACLHTVQNTSDRLALYGDIPSKHPPSTPSVKMGEIIDLNPNSYLTVKTLLHNLRDQAEVGVKRKWLRVGFDGVPYGIASSLIDNTVVCNSCDKEMNIAKTPFQQHVESEHPGQDIEYTKVFRDIFLVPGAGHIEINLLRAIFGICKHICLDHISDRLGFRSTRAKAFISRGSNHHVTWQVFVIMYRAFALELAYEYYLDCIRNDRVPSQRDWQEWRENDVRNANYHLLYDLVHCYFMGLACFRAGVRRNNSDAMLAGRQQIAPIMFIGKHRIYRKLIYRDMQTRIEAPKDIKAYIECNESFSRSGDETRGQGGDYVTEEENRDLKNCLPPGIPTLQSWQWASRCNMMLKQNRRSVFARASLTDPANSKTSIFNFEEEIQCIRADIRQSGILRDPTKSQHLRSLDGATLHEGLINMHDVMRTNYDNFKKSPSDAVLDPVFVTQQQAEDYNDMNGWTKDVIARKTAQLISNLVDDELSAYYKQMLTDARSYTKPHLIQFYYEVQQTVSNEKHDLELESDSAD